MKAKFFSISLMLLCIAMPSIVSAADDYNGWELLHLGPRTVGDAQVFGDAINITTSGGSGCWGVTDTFTFLYKYQAFPWDDCCTSSISTKITSVASEGSFGANNGIGLMMRSNLSAESAQVDFVIRSNGKSYLFYRQRDGDVTFYRAGPDLREPCEIKLVRQGTTFIGYYKNDEDNWVAGPSVVVDMGVEMYIGLSPWSANTNLLSIEFKDVLIEYSENYIPPTENYTDHQPIKEGTLLRDNFNDGSLSNTPESITNPLWSGIKHAVLPYYEDSDTDRYWHKKGTSQFFFGEKKWTDYECGVELTFEKGSMGELKFLARYQDIAIYNTRRTSYGFGLRNGNEVYFSKYTMNNFTSAPVQKATIPYYNDGGNHTFKFKVLDTTYEVYFDGNLVLKGEDTVLPILFGSIVLDFKDADVKIDNLEVIAIDDPLGGSSDNFLGAYFDQPIPEFLKKYGY